MQKVGGRITLSPSDLNDHLECPHLTTLALEVARGERSRPFVADEHAELLRRKGELHERAYLERLRAEGRRIVEITLGEPWDFEAAARQTAEAMRAGAEIISQATFVDGRWRGRADFLVKMERATRLGAWGYEPLDAKLARAEKPTYVLQLCFYSAGVAAIQGVPPERMHVLLGIGEQRALRYDDFAAYYRRVRAGFEAAIAAPQVTEPYPVEHCALCDFRAVCAARWEAEDHLVQVASVRRDQVTRLRDGGLPTLSALAQAAPGTPVADVAAHTFERLRDQAALQHARRTTGMLPWHAIAADPGCGFEALPPPSAGDLIFDIEGDPFWEPARGLHFLFGLLLRDGADWQYRAMWAHDRGQERCLFEDFVDLVHERLARDPGMHIYHYGVYEKTAITELMGVYATREDAVDDLLRREVFVDLHTVVRQGLRAGVVVVLRAARSHDGRGAGGRRRGDRRPRSARTAGGGQEVVPAHADVSGSTAQARAGRPSDRPCDPQRCRHDRGRRRHRRHGHASPRTEPEGRRPAAGDNPRRANKYAGAAWCAGSARVVDPGRRRALPGAPRHPCSDATAPAGPGAGRGRANHRRRPAA